MYDNIIIKADLQSINKTEYFVQAQSFPNSIPGEYRNEPAVIFYCRNLKVIVTAEEVTIIGSICKYHLGTSQYTLTRQTTEKAFEQLAEDLQLPIHLFNVMLFEFESNLIMDHDVQYYYAFFGDCKGFKVKSSIGGRTLFYENTYRRISFYDKIAQINNLKREPVKVIKEFNDKNVLRFGVRYQTTVCKKFNRSSLTVADLHSKEFYNIVVNKWKEDYFSIAKFKVKTFDDIVFTSKPSYMLDQYTILGILGNGGQAEALERIKRADKQNVFKFSANKKRCIDAINDLCNSESLFKEDKGIEELNRKINEEAERHLAM